MSAIAAALILAVGLDAGSAGLRTRTPAQVVRAWSRELNANRNEAAARLFAPNARIVQGSLDVRLTTHALAVEFNASLPCAGTIVRIQVHGYRAVATFRLGERPKHTCDGPGQKAAALFVVRNGKIVLWEQVPVPAPGPTA
jgi:limonene-1,2-epoxide hydrolase